MSKIQINDVKLDGAELFNDSETFLNQLEDSEMEQIVGGLTKLPPDEYVITTVYIPEEPIHPREPIHPVKPIHPRNWKPFPLPLPHPFPFPYHPQTPVIL
ncbi:MAG: hypothetical protein WBA39_09940 [Rivularia sp. (in: cyanobacteria)]